MKTIPLLIITICLPLFGCPSSANTYSVSFVQRSEVFPVEAGVQKSNPFMLVVEINENGNLKLNQIETGTIEDTALLSEKLSVIFDDRETSLIGEREVVIDRQGKIKNGDLEKLIESLANSKASPIRVIKNEMW